MTVTPAIRTLNEAFDQAVEELDYLLGRVCRVDPILRLQRNGQRYEVIDDRNQHVMIHGRYDMCVRFAHAFQNLHPETRLDASFGFAAVSGEPQAGSTHSFPVSQAGAPEPASPERLTPEEGFALAYNRLVDLLREDSHSRRVPDLSNVIPLPARGDVA